MNLRFYTGIIILVVFLVGLFNYSKLPDRRAKSLLGMLFVSLLTEIGGMSMGYLGLKNFIVYNTYVLIIFNYYLLLLQSLLKKSFHKKLTNVFFFLFNTAFVADLFYMQDLFEEMLTFSFALGVIFVLILSFLYLMQVFNSNRVLHFKKSIYFWIVLGLLIFHIPFLPIMIAVELFLKPNPGPMFSISIFVLNLLMYTCFTLGFLWGKKKYNY